MAVPFPATSITATDASDHNTRHENGGADEVSVAGLSGLIADDQHVLDAEVTAVAVALTLYDAQSILAAVSDNTPVAVTVGEQTLVGRITGGNITALTATQVRTLINVADGATAIPASYSRTFLVNAFHFPDPISEWESVLQGAHLPASLTGKVCWLPLNFLKLGDIITAYSLVGDAIETNALTLDCKLVRVNKANPLTTTDITNGAITQITADGNFDQAVNPDDETVITDSQYVLQLTGTTGVADEIYITGAEIVVTRLI